MPTLDVDKMPAGGNINSPASGSYGQKAALTNLKKQLPSTGAQPAPGAAPPPPVSTEPVRPVPTQREGRPPSGAALPPGIPSSILAPTDRPHVPGSTLLQPGAPPPPDMTSAQDRLRIIDMLAESPHVSESTRDWARMVRRILVGA